MRPVETGRVHTGLVRTLLPYCLAVTPPPPPPPHFRAKLLYRVILPPLHDPPPPAGRSSRYVVLQFLHVYACCKCRRVVFVYQACRKSFENWSWPFSLFSDGFLRPSSCRRSRWEESGCETTCYVLQKMATCTWPTTLPSFSTVTACRSKEFSASTALYRVREFVGGGGGGGA